MFEAATLFWKSKKYLIIGIAAIAIGIYILSLSVQLSVAKSSLKKEKAYTAQLEAEIEDLIKKNDGWRISLDQTKTLADKCTASVDDLSEKIKQAKIKAAEAIKNAEAISAYRQDQLNLASKRPANPDGGCALSIQHAKQDLRGKQ